MRRFLLLLALASLSGCDLSTEPEDHPTDPATETFAQSLQVNIATMTKTPSGAYYRDLVVGSGPVLSGSPTVVLSYLTFLKDGSAVGSAVSGSQPLSLMIVGLQEGMQGMRAGGERLIVVPSAIGYGNSNIIPGVPPNSTLVFDLIFKGFPNQ